MPLLVRVCNARRGFSDLDEVHNVSPQCAVYLMDELYDLAKTSPDSAESIADHINKRLQHKSPVVKWKVIMKRPLLFLNTELVISP